MDYTVAKEEGLRFYNHKCKCGSEIRYTSNKSCVACAKRRGTKWRLNNPNYSVRTHTGITKNQSISNDLSDTRLVMYIDVSATDVGSYLSDIRSINPNVKIYQYTNI